MSTARTRAVVGIALALAACRPRLAPPRRTLVPSPVDEAFARQPNAGPDFRPERFTRCGLDYSPPGCMTRIPGGWFLRGAQRQDPSTPNYDPNAADDEGPVRPIRLDAFWIHHQEVPAQHFQFCVEAGACRVEDVDASGGVFTYGVPGREFHPTSGVTWRGAADFCRWIGGRLPTEAEYELAARGPLYRRWPWGAKPAACPTAIMKSGCGAAGPAVEPSGESLVYEVQALAGNVWEWMADWYDAGYYARAPAENPPGPTSGAQRAQRGGGWMSEDPMELRSSARAKLDPGARLPDVGFRCVRPVGLVERVPAAPAGTSAGFADDHRVAAAYRHPGLGPLFPLHVELALDHRPGSSTTIAAALDAAPLPPDAVRGLLDAADAHPDDAVAQLVAAAALREQVLRNKQKDERERLQRILALLARTGDALDDDVERWLLAAFAHGRLGDRPAAITAAERARSQAPADPDVRCAAAAVTGDPATPPRCNRAP